MAASSRPPTINDVAEAAGVSRATASRALAGYGRVNEETTRIVKEAAAKIGYRPNEVARAMRAGKTKTIGLVVISDFTNAFFDRATKEIIDAAKRHGYQTLVAHTDESIENEKQAVRTLVEKRVDGLILVPSSDSDHEHLAVSSLGAVPVVLLDRRLPNTRFPSVTTDDYSGAVHAVEYAYNLGHRNMAFLVAVPGVEKSTQSRPPIPISTVEDRTNGFLEGSDQHSLNSRMVFCKDSQEGAEAAVEELLLTGDVPSIIFTSNNDMLLAVLRVAGKLEVKIGKSLSVVSFDDSPWAAAMSPSITVISRPVDELGRIAVEKLVQQMSDQKVSLDNVLPTSLIERDSVARI